MTAARHPSVATVVALVYLLAVVGFVVLAAITLYTHLR